ncbi:MAG: aldo/keto reductase [Phycisphaerales bacterium]|nr:MAG: aldo/keto reductase [Phycisphaerales bacterium]
MTREKPNQIDRRDFIRSLGAAGLGSALGGLSASFAASGAGAAKTDPNTAQQPAKPKVPQVLRRKLGRTGVKIPALSFGTFRVDVANQILLRKTLQHGVDLWDTAYNYSGGNSELGIGKFLSRNQKVRGRLFLATKASGARSVADVEKRLRTSLERMKTDYVDLYFGLHQCSNPALLTEELAAWARSAKKSKLIRFFGISTHQNSAQVLAAAARLNWIDAIMTPFNFRLMQDAKLQAAVDACHKAKIGLLAIKVQGMGQRISSEADRKLIEHFLKRDLTEGQAKIKLVLEDERFASACVGMKNLKVFNENLEIALDKSKLPEPDKVALMEHAEATCSGYCAGCANICASAAPEAPCIGDVMRYLMYYNGYGERAEARRLFAQIPAGIRKRLAGVDYSAAEARCPQRMPIGDLMGEAIAKLA